MSKLTRREREKKQMQLDILHAATSIILEQGYEKLSMRKIADIIDYSATAIYIYYKDKAAIIEGIFAEVFQEILQRVQEVYLQQSDASPKEKLRAVIIEYIQAMVDQAPMLKAVLRSGASSTLSARNPDEMEAYAGLAIIHKIIEEGIACNMFREEARHSVWVLNASILGFSQNLIESHLVEQGCWHKQRDIFLDLIFRGIYLSEG